MKVNSILFVILIVMSVSGIAQESAYYSVGFGKTDITYDRESVGMFGYGDYSHRTTLPNVFSSRIYSRAMIWGLENSNEKVIIVHADLGAISNPIHHLVTKKIRENLFPEFNPSNLIISATHTHCAPAGLYYYPSYSVTAPGINPELLQFTVGQMYKSIKIAVDNQELCTVEISR
ncbi:neutral/alkaline non-lysosomal ceramidase N-terminal domain-containing protein [Flavivirga sp. 57AJ16]|uniref:neutral/alkaline non-lysosomal ceramidase N-terminal domain-containing protein n=1 Tax=Flavivirga sp. 57AJ16 TaxID=3025307 RepID=UPI0023650EA6|nr:neutral/alkaline non-lysosomal ceramidase N-terminal domain-containing protein [Flavivirga sp. 57AJ16]MDD7885467.1 neutral/alkaline non-lysosomal ceramidase N-terminal domain-containing protein [Flavivirga sp. 57AJ16]